MAMIGLSTQMVEFTGLQMIFASALHSEKPYIQDLTA